MSDREYLIHGAGGVGCVVAARLAELGRPVTLVARGPHLEALQTDGLTMVGRTEGHWDLPAVADVADAAPGPRTVVLLAMKTGDTEAALDAAGDLYRDLPILCFQNGVANERFTTARGLSTYGCVVMVGGRILEPGVVANTGGAAMTIGRWPRGVDDVCEDVVADFVASAMSARVHEHVEAAKWGKLVRNLNNAYLALANLSVQESNRFEVHRRFMADVTEEAADVLEAAGVVEEPVGRRSTREQIARLREPGEWTHIDIPDDPDELLLPSTWQDLHFGRGNVEVRYFNGEIVELGHEVGIPTPLNRIVMERCEAAATQLLAPGSETTESLRAAAAALDETP